MTLSRSGLVFDDRFLTHETGTEATVKMRSGSFNLSPEPHPSSSFITRRIKEFLDGSGLTAQMQPIEARAASEDELAVYHTRAYIAAIQASALGGPLQGPWGEIDEETVISPGTFDAALFAVGGALNATDAVLEGQVRNAYALLRPPGHHATRNQAWGFCIFNNAVLAAHHARTKYGLERIMIVDWDVHHGNGTQAAFYQDPGVLFVSLHQQNWFPADSGELDQVGNESGTGYSINIPLPPGTGDQGYLSAIRQIVVPIGLQYKPQFIIISSGQDASWLDPLASMMMTMQGYRAMSQLMIDLATEVCAGRLVMLQEGGYSAPYVPYCAAATVEPLLGIDLGLIDLYATAPELKCCQAIFSHETQQALTAIRAHHGRWWRI